MSMTFSDLYALVQKNALDPSIYLQFTDAMTEFGNEIREKHGEYSKRVDFRLEEAKRRSDTDVVKLAWRIVFVMPPGYKEVAWWLLVNSDEKITEIVRETEEVTFTQLQ